MSRITDPYMLKPVLTPDGRPWVQRCYVCAESVDFLKMARDSEWIHVGGLVRHKKCRPETLK